MSTGHDPQAARESLERDLHATVEARRDLGPEYDAALVASFLAKVDWAMEQRARAERYHPRPKREGYPVALAYVSLGTGIPITGAAAGIAGWPGLAVAWLGILGVNVAAALGSRPYRER